MMTIMVYLLRQLEEKMTRLNNLRPWPEEVVRNLDQWFRVELTYTSNAIEGNTLSRQQTALVVEKGLTVDGKSIQEHLEAVNHAAAWDLIKSLADTPRQGITQAIILDIHRLVLQKIDELNAGRYRTVAVRIAGSQAQLPNAAKVPELMDEFENWLRQVHDHPVKVAADAHYKLVAIHPFVDGNGRVARLLLNLLLMQQGYPPALIRKEDRRLYIEAIEKAQSLNDMDDYYQVIYESIDHSLDIYLESF